MIAAFSRAEANIGRWWHQIGPRAAGLLLLLLCALAARWLHASIHHLPAPHATWRELLAAAIAFLSGTTGWALLAEGPEPFRRIDVPARHRRNILL